MSANHRPARRIFMLIPVQRSSSKNSAIDHLSGEDPLLLWPFAARQFVIDLDAIAVRIAEINPERNPIVDDTRDWNLLRLEPVIELLQIIHAGHPPNHMVQLSGISTDETKMAGR